MSPHAAFNSILRNLNGQGGPTLPLARFRLSPADPFLGGRCDSLPVAAIQWHAVSVSNPRLADNRGPQ